MTYGQFHLLFNLPLLLILVLVNAPVPPAGGELAAFAVVLLIVVVFTSPWDNFAAMWGIWQFPRERYSFRIGYLPIEEYLFFLLQSSNVMLGVRALLLHVPDLRTGLGTPLVPVQGIQAGVILAIWVVVGVWYARHLPPRRHYYAVHLLFWFLPVLVLQWVIAPNLMLAHAGLLAGVTLAFGAYYTAADLVAVHAGTWTFDEEMITGHKVAGILPWEEVAFFFLTSLLVAQSYILLLPAAAR